MAEILPFVGTRYTAREPSALASLISPPYDVISPSLQEELYARDPHNLARVDFGKVVPGDSESENRYTRAARAWGEWKANGVIAKDPREAFYVYEQEFDTPDGSRRHRRGFFAAVRLEDFAEGGIRAHEHTFAGPKVDRLDLMRATGCNLSPIFCLYDDPEKRADEVLARVAAEPIQTEFDGVTQRLWVLDDESAIEAMTQALAGKTLFIADGHHRYETNLMYRDEMRRKTGMDDGRQPFDYTMMYLNNIHDEGLIVLPTHRVLNNEVCGDVEADGVLRALSEFFMPAPAQFDPEAPEREAARLTKLLVEAGEQTSAFILVLPNRTAFVLKKRADVHLDKLIDEDVAVEVKSLDVTLLHRCIIPRGWLGEQATELDDSHIRYVKDAAEALRLVSNGEAGAAFLLNSTRIEQVCQVAKLGLRMPHKSTYFYPKVATGLIMRDLKSP